MDDTVLSIVGFSCMAGTLVLLASGAYIAYRRQKETYNENNFRDCVPLSARLCVCSAVALMLISLLLLYFYDESNTQSQKTGMLIGAVILIGIIIYLWVKTSIIITVKNNDVTVRRAFRKSLHFHFSDINRIDRLKGSKGMVYYRIYVNDVRIVTITSDCAGFVHKLERRKRNCIHTKRKWL